MRALLSLALWPLRTLNRRVTGYLDAALAAENTQLRERVGDALGLLRADLDTPRYAVRAIARALDPCDESAS
jgi:hypothetical protein